MVEERRQHQRLVPNAPLFIALDDSKSGLLLDLCEGGLAVASLVPRSLDEVVALAFDLPDGVGHVQAKAKIAWTRDAGHLTGVRFVDLDETSQQQLSEWISAGTDLRLAPLAETAEPVIVTRSSYAQVDPIPVDTGHKATPGSNGSLSLFDAEPEGDARIEAAKSEPVAPLGRERTGKARYSVELFLAVVVLSWALVFLGYQMGNTGASRQNREVTAAMKMAEAKPELASVASMPAVPAAALPINTPAPAPARAAKRTPAPTSAAASAAISMEAGVVLQVGAMKLEENAAAMAQELRKKKFPALVFRHSNDRLYRVAVGPYSEADSTARVKAQLEKEGFKPLRQRWAKE